MKSLDFLRLIWSIIIGVWVFSDGIDFWTIAGAGLTFTSGPYLPLVLHKIPAQNRCAASIAASKALYSLFLNLT